MSFQVGQRIGGRYEIHRIFGGEGKSGMGVVYVCFDHETTSAIALKTYQEGFFHDKILVDSFKRGALAWIHLDRHPYVVQALGVHKIAGRLFLGLEYIAPDEEDRNNLTHYLQGKVTLEKALTWSLQFCDAMEHAREKGITPHRDIKPDNIMMTNTGTLKVSDFDLAGLWDVTEAPEGFEEEKFADQGGLTFINTGKGKFVAGTPPWMAPEQFAGDADTRSDVYSFGIVMYQMASQGRLPIIARDGDWGKAHKNLFPEKVKSRLWPLIERCMQKNPANRFGGDDPNGGFVELRAAIIEMWEREMYNHPIPEPPEGRVFEAEDHNEKGVSLAQLGLFDQALREYKQAIGLDPKNALAYLNAGVAMAAKGDKEKASKAYRKAISLDPKLAEGYNNLGLIFKEQGDLEKAEKAYRKAIKLKSNLVNAYDNLGVVLSTTGRHNEAISLMAETVKRDPLNAGFQYNLGVTYEKAGQAQKAIAHYTEAVRLRPNSADYHSALGNGYRIAGDMQNAVAHWRHAVKLDPRHANTHFNLGIFLEKEGQRAEAFGHYQAAINAEPGYANPYFNIGLVYAQAELYGKGAEAFANFIRFAAGDMAAHIPKAEELMNKLKTDEETYQGLMKEAPEAVYNRGLAFLNLGVLDEAKAYLHEALERRPDYPAALTGMAQYYEKIGMLPKSAELLEKAVAIDPDYIIAWNNIGWVNYLMKKVDPAIAAYERFIKNAPPEMAHIVRGAQPVLDELRVMEGGPPPIDDNKTFGEMFTDILKQKQREEGGEDMSEELGQLFGDFLAEAQNAPPPAGGDDPYTLGQALYKEGRYDEAISAFRQAVSSRPDNPHAHNHLGVALLAKGLYDPAAESFGKASELDPDNPDFRYNLGLAHRQGGRVDQAMKEFKVLAKQTPNDSGVHFNIGLLYNTLQAYDLAAGAFQVAVRLNPKDQKAWCNLGVAYDNAGKPQQAIEAYCQSIEVDPKYGFAYYNLGLSLQAMGKKADALAAFYSFLHNADPRQQQYIQDAQDRIKILGG